MTKDKLLNAIATIQQLPPESSDLYTALWGIPLVNLEGEQELDTRITAYATDHGMVGAVLRDSDRIAILRAWLADLEAGDPEAIALAQILPEILGDGVRL